MTYTEKTVKCELLNLWRIAEILRNDRDMITFPMMALPKEAIIDVDVENPSLDGAHTDDDTINIHMPNGDVWQLTMEKVK